MASSILSRSARFTPRPTVPILPSLLLRTGFRENRGPSARSIRQTGRRSARRLVPSGHSRRVAMSRFLRAFALAILYACADGTANADDRSGSRPVRVCLVLDVSGSMREESRLDRMIAGVAATLAILPDGAEVAIVSFNDQAEVVVSPTRL